MTNALGSNIIRIANPDAAGNQTSITYPDGTAAHFAAHILLLTFCCSHFARNAY